MKIAQLQGTPWHMERKKKTCQDGSKYCIYNRNICRCSFSIYFNKKCIGKGSCPDFEPKTGTPKVYASKTYQGNSIKPFKNIPNKNLLKENDKMNEDNVLKESKEEKFLRISKTRIDKIEDAIENLEKLTDKYTYSYTDEQVEKMFSFIEKRIKIAKDRFKNKNSSGSFEW